MTKLPCKKYGFSNKGEIKEGFDAEIVIFNINTIEDKATLQNSTLLPEGISYVIINGKLAMKNGYYYNTLNGKVIRKDK